MITFVRPREQDGHCFGAIRRQEEQITIFEDEGETLWFVILV